MDGGREKGSAGWMSALVVVVGGLHQQGGVRRGPEGGREEEGREEGKKEGREGGREGRTVRLSSSWPT